MTDCLYKEKESSLPPGAFGNLAGSESNSVVHRVMLLGRACLVLLQEITLGLLTESNTKSQLNNEFLG